MLFLLVTNISTFYTWFKCIASVWLVFWSLHNSLCLTITTYVTAVVPCPVDSFTFSNLFSQILTFTNFVLFPYSCYTARGKQCLRVGAKRLNIVVKWLLIFLPHIWVSISAWRPANVFHSRLHFKIDYINWNLYQMYHWSAIWNSTTCQLVCML